MCVHVRYTPHELDFKDNFLFLDYDLKACCFVFFSSSPSRVVFSMDLKKNDSINVIVCVVPGFPSRRGCLMSGRPVSINGRQLF